MKKILKFYFDYICPYCYRGIMNLLELLPDYPELSVEWIPCEAHPRPEQAFIHSDLAGQAMYSIKEQGGNLIQFHKEIFTAHFIEHHRIDSPSVLADIAAACGTDRNTTLMAITDGVYRQSILNNNQLVWNTLGFEAVPCYQIGNRFLTSHEDVMISKKQLKDFLDSVMVD